MARKGQIALFAGNFTPEGWARCNGQNGTPNIPDLVCQNGKTIPYFIATEDQEDLYMAFIYLTATGFAPKGWLFCDGQLLNLRSNDRYGSSQYSAIQALINNKFGGDGQTTIALPKIETFQSGNMGKTDSRNYEQNYIRYMICVSGIFPMPN